MKKIILLPTFILPISTLPSIVMTSCSNNKVSDIEFNNAIYDIYDIDFRTTYQLKLTEKTNIETSVTNFIVDGKYLTREHNNVLVSEYYLKATDPNHQFNILFKSNNLSNPSSKDQYATEFGELNTSVISKDNILQFLFSKINDFNEFVYNSNTKMYDINYREVDTVSVGFNSNKKIDKIIWNYNDPQDPSTVTYEFSYENKKIDTNAIKPLNLNILTNSTNTTYVSDQHTVYSGHSNFYIVEKAHWPTVEPTGEATLSYTDATGGSTICTLNASSGANCVYRWFGNFEYLTDAIIKNVSLHDIELNQILSSNEETSFIFKTTITDETNVENQKFNFVIK